MTLSDGTDAMIDALRAAGPRPELADKLALFGQFAGSRPGVALCRLFGFERGRVTGLVSVALR